MSSYLEAPKAADPLLQFTTKRIVELESLLLAEVPETVWPAEVDMVYSQIEYAGALPSHHQRRLKHHINRMWLEKMLENDTFLAASEPRPIASAYSWGEC